MLEDSLKRLGELRRELAAQIMGDTAHDVVEGLRRAQEARERMQAQDEDTRLIRQRARLRRWIKWSG